MVYRQQQAHLSMQLIKPEQGEAPLRDSDVWCELRVPASPLDCSGGMSSPAALVLTGAAQLRHCPTCPTMRCCPSTASPQPLSCGSVGLVTASLSTAEHWVVELPELPLLLHL